MAESFHSHTALSSGFLQDTTKKSLRSKKFTDQPRMEHGINTDSETNIRDEFARILTNKQSATKRRKMHKTDLTEANEGNKERDNFAAKWTVLGINVQGTHIKGTMLFMAQLTSLSTNEHKMTGKRRLRVWHLLAAGLAFLLLILWWPQPAPNDALDNWNRFLKYSPGADKEPVYGGRALSDWIDQYDRYSEAPSKHPAPVMQPVWETNRADAVSAIQHMGTNALPALFDMLRYGDSRRVRWGEWAYGKWENTIWLGWVPSRIARHYFVSPAIAQYKHEYGRLGLEMLGPVATPALQKALNDTNPRVRETATNLLSKLQSQSSGVGINHLVKVPTGQERMTNAVRCMAYIVNLASNLPNEEKRTALTVGGLLFFDDCLMAKIKDGRVEASSNELWQSFSNAVEQVFSNRLPADLAAKLASPNEGNWQQSFPSIQQHEKWALAHPDAALVHGFVISFDQRNQFRMTLDDQYQWIAKARPDMGRKIKMVGDAISAAGVTDQPQSDLKNMGLAFATLKTSDHSTNYDAIFCWRLVNMYGLDEARAQAIVNNLARVPVSEFNRGDMQPPAWIE